MYTLLLEYDDTEEAHKYNFTKDNSSIYIHIFPEEAAYNYMN